MGKSTKSKKYDYRYIGPSSESKPRFLLAVRMGIVRNKSAPKAQSGTDLMSSKCMRSLAALGRTNIFTCFEPENKGFIVREMLGRNQYFKTEMLQVPFFDGWGLETIFGNSCQLAIDFSSGLGVPLFQSLWILWSSTNKLPLERPERRKGTRNKPFYYSQYKPARFPGPIPLCHQTQDIRIVAGFRIFV